MSLCNNLLFNLIYQPLNVVSNHSLSIACFVCVEVVLELDEPVKLMSSTPVPPRALLLATELPTTAASIMRAAAISSYRSILIISLAFSPSGSARVDLARVPSAATVSVVDLQYDVTELLVDAKTEATLASCTAAKIR